ncbi:MAG: ribosomal protein S18-alanine N-acetyltransferase [Anaerolineales bacterium]|nr:ribosomal protein S18-alanine N-acetyltransferase [Anaerolineales bacterium]
MSSVIFSPLTLADIPYIGELETRCFPAPWTIETYRNELMHNTYSHYWVLRPSVPDASVPPILAYGGYWLMGEEAHVVTVATHPDFRRQGLAEQLMIGIIEKVREARGTMVTLEVRVSNVAAQRLYAKLGFVEVGLRKGYYNDNHEDALLMTIFFFPERTEE